MNNVHKFMDLLKRNREGLFIITSTLICLLIISGMCRADYGMSETYNTTQNIDFVIMHYNRSSGTGITGATCTMNITNQTFVTALATSTMKDLGGGLYNWSWSYGAIGDYYAQICCIKASAGSCSMIRFKLVNSILQDSLTSNQNILQTNISQLRGNFSDVITFTGTKINEVNISIKAKIDELNDSIKAYNLLLTNNLNESLRAYILLEINNLNQSIRDLVNSNTTQILTQISGFESETTAAGRYANLTTQILGKGGSNLTTTDLDAYCDLINYAYVWNQSQAITNVSIYNYFTDGTNENQFKADVTALATSLQLGQNTTTLLLAIAGKGGSNLTEANLDSYCASQAEITTDHGTGLYNGTTADISTLATRSDVTGANQTVHAKLDIIQTDLDNPNQYKADISGLETEATAANRYTNITNNQSAIHTDVLLIEKESTALSRYDNLSGNLSTIYSYLVNTVYLKITDTWNYITNGTLTSYIWNTQSPRTITGGNSSASISDADMKNMAYQTWNQTLFTTSNYSWNGSAYVMSYSANKTLVEIRNKASSSKPIVW